MFCGSSVVVFLFFFLLPLSEQYGVTKKKKKKKSTQSIGLNYGVVVTVYESLSHSCQLPFVFKRQ